MELKEAADLLKEIIDRFPDLEGKHFLIITEDAPSKISSGYEVVIRTDNSKLDSKTKQSLYDIATIKKLDVIDGRNTFSIYTRIREKEKAVSLS